MAEVDEGDRDRKGSEDDWERREGDESSEGAASLAARLALVMASAVEMQGREERARRLLSLLLLHSSSASHCCLTAFLVCFAGDNGTVSRGVEDGGGGCGIVVVAGMHAEEKEAMSAQQKW
jgi:hypothetical protein